jgi:hypothetical protein
LLLLNLLLPLLLALPLLLLLLLLLPLLLHVVVVLLLLLTMLCRPTRVRPRGRVPVVVAHERPPMSLHMPIAVVTIGHSCPWNIRQTTEIAGGQRKFGDRSVTARMSGVGATVSLAW